MLAHLLDSEPPLCFVTTTWVSELANVVPVIVLSGPWQSIWRSEKQQSHLTYSTLPFSLVSQPLVFPMASWCSLMRMLRGSWRTSCNAESEQVLENVPKTTR